MECTDLMLDDWVLDTYTGKPMRVHCVNIKVGKGLEPIPITPEILEKNGFTKGFDDDLVLMECGRIVMEIGNNYTRFKDGKMYLRRVLAPLYYVHELQHALKLCRIDKEIVI